jgi:PAS domain S-box-containing protein
MEEMSQAKPPLVSENSILLEAIQIGSSALPTEVVFHLLAQKLTEAAGVTGAYITDWQASTSKKTVVGEFVSVPVKKEPAPSLLGNAFYQYMELSRNVDWVEKPHPIFIRLSDAYVFPDTVRHLQRLHAQSVWIIPVGVQGKIVGFAELWDVQPNRLFAADVLLLCQSIAHQAATLLVHAHLAVLQERNRQEADILLEIGAIFAGTLTMADALDKTLFAVRRYLKHVQSCDISILEQDGRFLRVHSSWSERAEYELVAIGNGRFVDETTFSRLTIRTKQPVVIADLRNSIIANETLADWAARGLRALLYVPMMVHETIIGILHINMWHQPYQFTAEEIALCQGVAQQAAVAIQNAQLFSAQQSQLKIAQTMQAMGRLLTASLPMQDVYDKLFDFLSQIIPYDSASLHLQDEYVNRTIMVAGRGFKNMHLVQQESYHLADQWLEKIPIPPGWELISDTRNDPRWNSTFVQEPEIRSWLGAALLIKDRLIGVVNLDRVIPNGFVAQQGELLVNFARQAAIALENARLHEQIMLQTNELLVLHHIAAQIVTLVNLDELLTQTCATVSQLYSHVFGFVLVDEQTGHLLPHPSFIGLDLAQYKLPVLYESLIGLVVHTGQYQLVNHVQTEPLYIAGLPDPQSQIALMIPLQGNTAVLGVLIAESSQLNSFSERDVHFLRTLAGNVSAAIERARLYETMKQQKDVLAQQVTQRTAELKQERDKTYAILENAGEGIVFTNADLRIEYVNPAMEQMSGYHRYELLGHKIGEIGLLQISRRESQQIAQIINREHLWSGEMQLRRKNGSLYTASVTVTPIWDEQGKTIGFVSMQTDISKLKEVERLKAEFVSNITHELRTPLTNIKNFVALLQKGRLEKQERYFQIVNTEINRLNFLIQDLLDVARLDAEFTPDPAASVDVLRVLQTLITNLLPEAENKQVQLLVQLPDQLPLVHIAQAHMQQVLTPVLDNAITYTHSGGVVQLTAVAQHNNGRSYVCVQVQDNGPGISEEELTHIFDRFYRGEIARAINAPGTGIGLPVAQKIIEQYDGFVDVVSHLGKGSTFSLWFPQAINPTA